MCPPHLSPSPLCVVQLWLQAHPPGQSAVDPAVVLSSAVPCCCCLLLLPQPATSVLPSDPQISKSSRLMRQISSLKRVSPADMQLTGGKGEGGKEEGPVQSNGLLDQSLRMPNPMMGDSGGKTFRATVAQSEW